MLTPRCPSHWLITALPKRRKARQLGGTGEAGWVRGLKHGLWGIFFKTGQVEPALFTDNTETFRDEVIGPLRLASPGGKIVEGADKMGHVSFL